MGERLVLLLQWPHTVHWEEEEEEEEDSFPCGA
jgi:hypothetical protein